MLSNEMLDKYAELVLSIGVNLQKGQGLTLICPVECRKIAHAFTKSAYKLGASIVDVRWGDEEIDKLNYEYADTDTLCNIPKWVVENRNHIVKENYCYVAISAENPLIFSGISPEKLSAVAKARAKALKNYTDAVMSNKIRWCVVSVPTIEWAKQVFKNSDKPVDELWEAIANTMRLYENDPVIAWKNHIERLEKRAEFLNKNNFEYLHFKNSLGTDLMVGLANSHVWLSAQEKAQDNVNFVANMPTEEVFTAPHRLKVDGVVKSALPLIEKGNIIDNFTLTFKNGKVVKATAEKNEALLNEILDTDAGTRRIGEVALIGKNSPIAKSKLLFYNTLFDENASCHLAIGKAYPSTIKNGVNLNAKELKALGANDSDDHIDFMIGTNDLSVTGIKFNGEMVRIFLDGDWVI